MNREKAFLTIGDLDDHLIAETVRYMPEEASGPSERMAHMKTKRMITLALAAALILSLGIVAYAGSEIFEYRRLQDDPELQQQAEQGAEELRHFTFDGLAITPVDEALYLNNDSGQSGLTNYEYTVDGTDATVQISYYDTGEIQTVDARELYPLDYAPYENEYEWFNNSYPDREAYRERLIEAAPGLLDTLHEEGWIRHSSDDIEKAGILDIHVFWDSYAQIRVLMKDDTSYELWLEPDSFALEGFMYWNERDTQVIRNGFFPALKEDRLEEWWDELMANSVG